MIVTIKAFRCRSFIEIFTNAVAVIWGDSSDHVFDYLININFYFFQVALLFAALAAANASVLLKAPIVSTGVSASSRQQDVSISYSVT